MIPNEYGITSQILLSPVSTYQLARQAMGGCATAADACHSRRCTRAANPLPTALGNLCVCVEHDDQPPMPHIIMQLTYTLIQRIPNRSRPILSLGFQQTPSVPSPDT